ncbi:MAG: hypothetical protein M1839_004252 [Geoglossum umbratile]|nr:MAG: hypothetical protein M1839_004252 [Geoglossum umbratile]
MTQTSQIRCIHEPFGDAFYFGTERLSDRYENDEKARRESGFADVTFGGVVKTILEAQKEGKRLFIKDIAHYLIPPNSPTTITTSPPTPPSLLPYASNKPPIPTNPTVLPLPVLRLFHWTFLIRHPRYSIPSYYRCTIPPLSAKTGFTNFLPSEAGYQELRQLFEHLVNTGLIGPRIAGRSEKPTDDDNNKTDICVIDATTLLAAPHETLQTYCASTSLPYHPSMLSWSSPAAQALARPAFAKWPGFHDDVIASTGLRTGVVEDKSREDEDREWRECFGEEAARMIRRCVEECLGDYEFLRKFAVGV